MVISNTELEHLIKAINEKYYYDFSGYSSGLIKRRIVSLLLDEGICNFIELYYLIISNENYFKKFIQKVTINYTEMFRDPYLFKSLKENVFPDFVSYPTIKIWHAGCSTGEEVYSLAILLFEADLLSRSIIYATDINQKSLNEAREGYVNIIKLQEYNKNYLESGGKRDLSLYFSIEQNQKTIKNYFCKKITFAFHNLVSDSYFNDFDLIICRNVLIYFEPELQNKVINLFTNSLNNHGYLVLGSKESINFTEVKSQYDIYNKNAKIFRKKKMCN